MDFKGLLDELKGEGIEVAEESAKVLIRAVMNWLEKEVIASENKYDDLLLAVMPIMKQKLLELADDINKDDNA